ncbi:MAG: efflux RND transporter periplasmic adaptor subunit [Kangiellaceae bacterium]|nr:efflux RND transporter periplasmic adaptor subunit [Kangiellaceae bacterium]
MKNLIYSGLFAASMSLTSTSFAQEVPKQIVSVKTAKSEEVAPTIWVSGDVISRASSRISSEQNGRLTWLLDVGKKVASGDPIATIDARHLEIQLAEKSSELRQQQANTEFLQKQKKRLAALANNNSTARSEVDRVERDLLVANERLSALTLQMSQIKLSIEKATIRAPFSGTISQRLAEQGEFVNIGTPLVQLVDLTRLDIRVAAPLDVLDYLNHNQKITIRWKQKLIDLPVRTWSPAGDLNSRTFDLRLDASNQALISGSAVTVSLPTQLPQIATLVPRDALILRERETYVVKVDTEQSATKVSVTVGTGVGKWVAIDGSINRGDSVVIRGGERLKTGDKVRVESIPGEATSNSLAAN